MQTLNDSQKNKDTQASGRKRVNTEVQVNDWSIYDAYMEAGFDPDA